MKKKIFLLWLLPISLMKGVTLPKIADPLPIYTATVFQLQMELVVITSLIFTIKHYVSINVNIFYKHLLCKDCLGNYITDICLSSIICPICPYQAHEKVIPSSWLLSAKSDQFYRIALCCIECSSLLKSLAIC